VATWCVFALLIWSIRCDNVLTANELTDNSVTNNVMTVIWAHGQAPGDSPAAGNFYRQDEIKYHATNRGVTNLNFYSNIANFLDCRYLIVQLFG